MRAEIGTTNRYQEAAERFEQQLEDERKLRQAQHDVRRAEAAEYRRLTDAMPSGAILYPDTMGGFPPCTACFQRTSDMALAADPRDHLVKLLCGGCSRALAAGRPVPLPTGEALVETWRRLARLHQNEEIGDEVAASALETLAPHLSREDGWAALGRLQYELLQLQAAEDPDTVLDNAATGPDHNPETYVNHLRGCVDDAVHALVGSAA